MRATWTCTALATPVTLKSCIEAVVWFLVLSLTSLSLYQNLSTLGMICCTRHGVTKAGHTVYTLRSLFCIVSTYINQRKERVYTAMYCRQRRWVTVTYKPESPEREHPDWQSSVHRLRWRFDTRVTDCLSVKLSTSRNVNLTLETKSSWITYEDSVRILR